MNSYNLIDSPWIPLRSNERISLREAFERDSPCSLEGTPFEKIALLRLLLAIAQAASTPSDLEEWRERGAEGIATQCIDYLNCWHERFWLHGEHPFLQFPRCSDLPLQSYGYIMPEVAVGNSALFRTSQIAPKELSDARQVLLLLQALSFGLAGKVTARSVSFSPHYAKSSFCHAGSGLGFIGIQHSFLKGRSLRETVWLNLMTQEELVATKQWTEGVGLPPWEEMPDGEDCPLARRLRRSLMGTLIPLGRFCLLEKEGLRFVEGIQHLGHKDGMLIPSASYRRTRKGIGIKYVDTTSVVGTEIAALLCLLEEYSEKQDEYTCLYLKNGLSRINPEDTPSVTVWTGGAAVSRQMNIQYFSGNNDFMESEFVIETRVLKDDAWFGDFVREMQRVRYGARKLQFACRCYEEELSIEGVGGSQRANSLFWELVHPTLYELMMVCRDPVQTKALFRRYFGFLCAAYDMTCPHGRARQTEAWICFRPSFMSFFDESDLGFPRDMTPEERAIEMEFAELFGTHETREGEGKEESESILFTDGDGVDIPLDIPTELNKEEGGRLRENRFPRLSPKEFVELVLQQGQELGLRKRGGIDKFIAVHVFPKERLAYSFIGNFLCSQRIAIDGKSDIGLSLRSCYQEAKTGRARLRRLLACTSVKELTSLLRQDLSFIAAKATSPLCYARLLEDLLRFERGGENACKAKWARSFWQNELPKSWRKF